MGESSSKSKSFSCVVRISQAAEECKQSCLFVGLFVFLVSQTKTNQKGPTIVCKKFCQYVQVELVQIWLLTSFFPNKMTRAQ